MRLIGGACDEKAHRIDSKLAIIATEVDGIGTMHHIVGRQQGRISFRYSHLLQQLHAIYPPPHLLHSDAAPAGRCLHDWLDHAIPARLNQCQHLCIHRTLVFRNFVAPLPTGNLSRPHSLNHHTSARLDANHCRLQGYNQRKSHKTLQHTRYDCTFLLQLRRG